MGIPEGAGDMAIGLALLLGIRLPTNFRQPYCAPSIIDFWHRWHITLSHWLRDYLYIPLGGNRHGRAAEFRNILITMVLGGLWHGAHWTFIGWGAVHGIALAIVHGFRRASRARRLPIWLTTLASFHFVTLAWVLFRAPDMAVAGTIAALPVTASWGDIGGFLSANAFRLGLIAVFFAFHRLDDHRRVSRFSYGLRGEIFWPIVVLVTWTLLVINQGTTTQFIYFQF